MTNTKKCSLERSGESIFKIKILTSLSLMHKDSSYTQIQDSQNPILSYNHYVIITGDVKERIRNPELKEEYLEIIYYNYASNDTLLNSSHYHVNNILMKMLTILANKKVLKIENSIEREIAIHLRKITVQKSHQNVGESGNGFACGKLIEAICEDLEHLAERKASEIKSEKAEFDDYLGKKYLFQESFKLIKLILLHKYEIYV